MSKNRQIIALFIIASNSLLLAGSIFDLQRSILEVSILLGLCTSGTLVIYGYDFAQFNQKGYNELVSNVLKSPIQTFFYFLFIVVIVPFAFFQLSNFRINTLLIICLFGLLYSVPLNFIKKDFKLKKIFYFKNVFIGFSWGGLILVGAGSCSSSIVLAFFLFTSIQVMIGSSIRDIADIQKDQNSGMITLPVRFGIKNTVRILNALNLCSLGALFFALETNYWIVMALVFLWRAIVLAKVKIPKESILWTQTMNILTCTLLLLTMLVIKISPWIFS